MRDRRRTRMASMRTCCCATPGSGAGAAPSSWPGVAGARSRSGWARRSTCTTPRSIRARYPAARRGPRRSCPTGSHYAVKANSNLAILRLLRDLGAGADIVSGGEMRRALAAGFDPPDDRLQRGGEDRRRAAAAVAAGVGHINLESVEELQLLGPGGPRTTGHAFAVGIRVNPDVTADTHPYITTGKSGIKFGVPSRPGRRRRPPRSGASPRLQLASLAMHLGQPAARPGAVRRAGIARLLATLADLVRGAGHRHRPTLDIGGGLGIRYRSTRRRSTPAGSRRPSCPLLAPTGLTVVPRARPLPGRQRRACCSTEVLYRKHSGGKEFVVVDAGMNDLVRPSHYQAHHEIVGVRERDGRRRASTWWARSARPAISWRWTGSLPAVEAGRAARGARRRAPTASSWPRTTTPARGRPRCWSMAGAGAVVPPPGDGGRALRGRAVVPPYSIEGAVAQHHDGILIIDFGSQYTQLIARRVREAHVYCEIHPPTRTLEWIREWKPQGIILSGGPNSVYDDGRPPPIPRLLELGVAGPRSLLRDAVDGPALRRQGGARPARREYGRADGHRWRAAGSSRGFAPGEETPVWMSHGDHVDAPPPGYTRHRLERQLPVAAFEHQTRPLLRGAVPSRGGPHRRGAARSSTTSCSTSAGCTPDWTAGHFIETEIARIRELVGPERPGHLRALGRGGLLGGGRAGAPGRGRPAHLHLRGPRAPPAARAGAGRADLPPPPRHRPPGGRRRATRFLDRLAGVTDPEEKRRRIGHDLHRRLRGRGPRGRRRRRVPGAGHALSRRDRVVLAPRAGRRSRSRPTTTWAGCPSGCPSS